MITPDLNVGEVAVGVANHLVDRTLSALSSSIRHQISRVSVALKRDFEKYVTHVMGRVGTVRTLVSSDQQVPTSSIYISLDYLSGDTRFSDKQIIDLVSSGHRALITGTAGGGKSMLIKYATLSLFQRHKEIIPIYFELRSLNDANKTTLLDALHQSVQSMVPSISIAIFKEMLTSGAFALVLDGFDEVNHDIRSNIGSAIENIAIYYTKLPILITTRPEDRAPNITSFTTYHAQPMSKDQCIALLQKINYDRDVLDSFISQVNDNLYEKHREFLSIPLMTNMMLLTYSHHSDIPSKIHLFYQQAFETLFQRHDRSKGTFTRKMHSNISIDIFQRILEHFSALSYLAEKFHFTESELSFLIRKSLSYVDLNVDPADFIKDLIESTCLLQPDGIYISFVHRSFQEYFSAKFVLSLDDESAKRIIDAMVIARGNRHDCKYNL